MRKIEYLRAKTHLADDEGRRLRPGDLPILQQQHFDQIDANRDISGEVNGGTEQGVAEEADIAGLVHEIAGALLVSNQRRSELAESVRIDVGWRIELELVETDLVAREHLRGSNIR